MLPVTEETKDIILTFIMDRVGESGADGVVVGLSGGLDSAVVLKLSVMALGKDRVFALLLHEKREGTDYMHAVSLAESEGVEYDVVEIGRIIDAYSETLGNMGRREISNVKARVRMTILHERASEKGMLVMGTSNKSELLTGYFTKFGDGGVDLMPIGDLYKTQVRELARMLGIPDEIVEKTPSAGLYEGQTDEEDLGMGYGVLDCILYGIERDMDDDAIIGECNCPGYEVNRVREMIHSSVHKRKLPLIPKMGLRTVGWDWRE
jgi:NAD+ synthase